jgi:glucose/arabinose dehydrogenase
MRRLRPVLLMAAAGILAGSALTACSSAGGSSPPTWVPSPAQVRGGEGGGGGGLTPIVPVPEPTGTPSSGGEPTPSGGSPSPSKPRKARDPLVVATHLTAPVGLAMLPDGTALVGERTTGRIVRVQPVAGRPVPTVRRLAGLDASGDGGLLDLAVSPSYAEDNLIYAFVTTAHDNRVVDFTLHGPVTPVLTGIPKGRTGNTGRIAFGANGELYVGTGAAGHPELAQRSTSLAGKVLRVDPIGDPPRDNPHAGSPVYTSGHRVVNGLCSGGGTIFEVEAGEGGRSDEVNPLVAGEDYGYPATSASSEPPIRTLPAADRAPGGCAVQSGRLFVTSLDGTALLAAPLAGPTGPRSVGPLAPVLVKKYGRLRTVVAARDGALWLTTSNRDGAGHPVATDERVIRYVNPSAGGDSPA